MTTLDTLALYKAVMGDAWSEDYQKVRARRALEDHRLRSPRSRRGASVRSLSKLSMGSRAAIFKKIRKGGCKTRRSLATQLDYINDKAHFAYSNLTNSLERSPVLTEGQKEKVINSYMDTWRGTAKYGFTSHMLISFPTDVPIDAVQGIALDFCERVFESGHYGDEWNYVMAVHTDREHPHAHIILNNRGKYQGEWFSCWREGTVTRQLMRELQAEIAEDYGVVLDATTRLERGILEREPSIEEVYAAQAEGRVARGTALTEEEAAQAQSVILGFAQEYRNVADLLRTAFKSELADSVEAMAIALENGEQLAFGEGDIDMQTLKDIKTVAEAVEFAEANMAQVQSDLGKLDGAARVPAELAAEPALQRNAPYVSDPQIRHDYNRIVDRVYPPGADAGVFTDLEMLLSDRVNDEFREVLDYGREIGLDVEEQLTRYIEGGSTNLGTVNRWIERDLQSIVRQMTGDAELTISDATPDQYHQACDKIDAFQMRLTEQMGLEVKSAFLSREDFEGKVQGLVGNLVPDDELSNAEKALQWFADILRTQDRHLTDEQEEALADWLFDTVHTALGEEGRARLERGDYKVLEGILDNPVDQIDVTRQYLETSAEERGAPELSDIANDLLGDRADIVGAQINAKARQRALQKGFDLSDEDDMGM